MRPLSSVRPNGWNPNRMAPHVYESLRHALKQDGWLASQALLVWGTDDKGARRDAIIDGEHRWTVAREIGFTEGPMVFLDGIPEARAKALTIAMNNRRGEFDDALLADLVKSIEADIDAANLALDLALADSELSAMLAALPTGSTDTADQPDPTPAAPPLDFQRNGLADRFGIVPFTVLNAREGWWQDRKRAWLALGIQSELGRGAPTGGSPEPLARARAGMPSPMKAHPPSGKHPRGDSVK
jgi:hypothetical protein